MTALVPLTELSVDLPPAEADLVAITDAIGRANGRLRLPIPMEVPDGVATNGALVEVAATAPGRAVSASITAHEGGAVVVSVQTRDPDTGLPCEARDAGIGTQDPGSWTPIVFRGSPGCLLPGDALTSVRWTEADRTYHAELPTEDREALLEWLGRWVLTP